MKRFKQFILSILCIFMSITLLHPMQIIAVEDTNDWYEEEIYKEPEATILNEDLENRTESTKEFIMSDKSTQTILYSVPVHYEADGEWKEIDNRLIDDGIDETTFIDDEENDEVNGYQTKDSKLKIKFSKKMHKKNLASIKYDDYKITWGFEDFDNKSNAHILSKEENEDPKLKIYDNISQSIIYEDIKENVSLQYSIDSLKIKEDIILKEKQDNNEFEFNYKTKNLELVLNESGDIEAKDIETNDVIFTMPKPFMIDDESNRSDSVAYELIDENNGKYTIKVIANKEWLNSEERVYPVIIDPVIKTETSQSAIDTTFITSWKGDANYSTKLELLVGTETSEYGYCRTLVKFDLPSLNKGDMIVDAQLNIASYKNDFYGTSTPDLQVNALMLTSDWNLSSVTWNTRPSYDGTVLDYDFISKNDQTGYANWKQFDITSAVKSWYEGTANYGIQLKSYNESTDYAKYGVKGYLWPERYNTTTNAYPYIALTYRNNKGIENYWDYSTISTSSGDAVAINNYSGNLVVSHLDAATTGRMPLTITHVYNGYMANANVANVKPYVGKGWKLSIQQTLLPSTKYGLSGTSASTYPYVYMDEDGTEHYFKQTNSGLVDEDGLGLELTVNTSNYIIRDKDENTMTFNSLGLLTEIMDRYGDKLYIFYNGTTITDVVDAVGNPLVLETNSEGYLTGIEDHVGRTVSFTYSNGLLSRISGRYSYETSNYTYDSDGSMTTITANDFTSLTFSYTSLSSGKRVRKILEKGSDSSNGQTIRYDRSSYNITKITTSGVDNIIDNDDDIITKLEFDNGGRLKTRYAYTAEKDLGAETLRFSASKPDSTNSDIKKLNRITMMSNPSPTIVNYLKNHSGESTTSWSYSQSVGTSTFTFESTDEEYLFGEKSFKLSASETSELGRARFNQDVNTTFIKPNTTYTASGYIKTKNIQEVSGQTSGGAAILVYIKAASLPTNEDPEAADFVSEYVVGTTDETVNDGWRRVSITFTTPSDVSYVRFNGTIRGATGTAYFDGLQLEEGETANPYNMVENASFENVTNGNPDSWTKVNLTSADVTNTDIKKFGNHSFMITPSATTEKEIRQTIPINGKENDTYVLSGWVYGKGVTESDSSRKFKISVYVKYSDGTGKWTWASEFNTSVKGWKYASCSFDLTTSGDKTPVSIMISVRSFSQANAIYYDGIQLLKRDIDLYNYDSNGNMIKEGKKVYTYDSDDQMITATDGIDTKFTYTYDDKGSLISTTNNINKVSEDYSYDNYGNLLSNIIQNKDANLKIKTENVYDSTNSYIVEEKDADGRSIYHTFNNGKGLLLTITDQNQNTITYGYDDLDRIATITKGDISNIIEYNNKNYLNKIITEGSTYAFGYDAFSNRTTSSIGNTVLATNTYKNYNGDLEKVTYANGHEYSYVYDEFGHIVKLKENGTIIQSNVYDSEGSLVYSIDYKQNLKTQYDYDLDGKVIRIDVFDTNITHLDDKWLYGIEYGYDDHDRIIKKNTKVGNEVRSNYYEYKDGSYLETYNIDNSKKITYDYDSLNRLTSKTLNTTNPITISYAYASSARGSGYTTNKIATEKIGNITYTYNYDVLGNITSITDSNGLKVLYIYDENSRLIEEYNQFTIETCFYSYDESGNIRSKMIYPYTTGALSSYINWITYSYENENWKDQLTSLGDDNIIYDEVGNPTTYRDNTLTWNGKQLISFTNFFGDVSTYIYGSNGLRTSKTVNGFTTEYQYLDGVLIKETGPNGILDFTYDNLGKLVKISHTKNNSTNDYYVLTNSRGDVEQIYNSSGILQCRYIYDSWGRISRIVDSDYNTVGSNNIGTINPITYRGYYFDHETGFYYLNSRYYDPQIGRFINADDISVTSLDPTSLYDKNLYAYCDNNPISRKDTTGAVWETVFDVGSLAASIVEVAVNPTDVWAWAGLVGDAIDLAPFITGVGETIKAVDKLSDIDDVVDTAKSLKKTVSKAVGVYEIEYASGINYVGKGPFSRAIQSAIEHTEPSKLNNNLGDTVVSIKWKQSENSISAFMEEFGLQSYYRGMNKKTYNRIWSPGRKYYGKYIRKR